MSEKHDVKKVAELARLKLDEDQIAFFQEKFTTILDYFDILAEVDIDQPLEEKDESMQVTFREDVNVKSDVSPDQFSKFVVDKAFKVPKVIE
ncbi:MAG: Asp-tRNA(Asn)/Glu-tRNA(Gln) amidotransferase subunit GatC [Deltaproteobacteria bacterium]|nr:Asp-tRNA(Asn)/Glu-tRNA(Gln) amidotransferase subunit GatC [Deltaproteobacteria bacterium]